jgi:hypothetical protein
MTRAPKGSGLKGATTIGIDNQGGVIHNVNLYQQAPGDDPERNLETGIDLLEANLARRAAEFLTKAYEGGLKTNRLLFHWTLAILSGRSDIDLTPEQGYELRNCIDATDYAKADQWSRGMEVVEGLLWISGVSRRTGFDQAAFDEVLRRAGALDAATRNDLLLHLDRLVSGSVFDFLWEDHREHVEQLRRAGDREQRVPKFFIHDQVPPKMPVAVHYKARAGTVWRAVGGLVIAVAVVLLVTLADLGYGLALIAATAASTALIVYYGKTLALCAKRIRDRQIELRGVGGDPRWRGLDFLRAAFYRAFGGLLDLAFEEHTPKEFSSEQWLAETKYFRWTTAFNVTLLYGGGGTQPGELRWLAEHLARTQAAQVESGLLRDPRFGVPDVGRERLAVIGGIALFAATVLSVGLSTGALGFLFTSSVVAAGLWMALPAVVELVVGPVYDVERRQRAEEAFRLASQTHAEWSEWLADRPGDTEMAQWLAADLSWLRIEATKALRLPHSDVIAHFAISEPAEDARAARVPFGPTRYSTYNLRIFLLTENGVRVYEVKLDFTDGSHLMPSTDNFRYDMIVSARVVEIGVRYGDSRRTVVELDKVPHYGPRDFTLAHALNLQLHGRELRIFIGVNRASALVNGGEEDSDSLLALDIESSGIEEGLRILQAVAGEGKGWIETERARQRQFLRQERRGRPAGVDSAPSFQRLALGGPEPDDPA